MFDNNFGKCGSIFKIFHQLISSKILLCMHHKDFHLTYSNNNNNNGFV